MERIIKIGNIEVDITGLMSIAHTCDPALCREQESCCAYYEICCEENEIPRLISMLPKASEYVPALQTDGGYDNVFEEADDGLFSLDSADDGLCIFAYRNECGAVLCSLHTAAQDLGIDFFAAKPQACLLWPLGIIDDDPVCLSAHPDALQFPCNRKRHGKCDELDPGIAEIVRGVFGESFYARLCAAI